MDAFQWQNHFRSIWVGSKVHPTTSWRLEDDNVFLTRIQNDSYSDANLSPTPTAGLLTALLMMLIIAGIEINPGSRPQLVLSAAKISEIISIVFGATTEVGSICNAQNLKGLRRGIKISIAVKANVTGADRLLNQTQPRIRKFQMKLILPISKLSNLTPMA